MGVKVRKILSVVFFLFIFAFAHGVSAAALSVKQGEVLLYPINFPSATSVVFGGVKVPVFDYAGTKYALISADLSKKVGSYNLHIKNGDTELEKKVIAVKKGTYKQVKTKVAYKFVTLPKKQQENVVKDKAPLLALLKAAVIDATQTFAPSFQNPLDAMTATSPFGYKRIYTNHTTVHQGVDLRASVGTPVYAIGDGQVLWGEGQKPLYLEGPMIAIDHGKGIVSEYLHLSKVVAQTGAAVHAGDIIGYSGDQGADVTGPHLHFAIRVGDSYINPLQFMKEFQKLQ